MLPVVPASPGFFVVTLIDDYDPAEPGSLDRAVRAEPIVAWRVGHELAEPVTAETKDYSNEEVCSILQPDGKVLVPGNANYNSLEEWARCKLEEEKAFQGHE